jgi:hypothetical protein
MTQISSLAVGLDIGGTNVAGEVRTTDGGRRTVPSWRPTDLVEAAAAATTAALAAFRDGGAAPIWKRLPFQHTVDGVQGERV